MITTTRLPNGLTIIVEEMSHVESVSFDLVIPGGYLCDPADKVGASVILTDLIGRGAGGLSSREISDAFDSLGIRHGEGTGSDRFGFSGTMVSDSLGRALELVSFMVKEPHFPEDEIPNIQSVLLQDIESLNDNPARRAMIELTKRYYPAPYSRSSMGEAEGIRTTTRATIVDIYTNTFGPEGACFSFAGKVKTADVVGLVEKYFGSWKGKNADIPAFGAMPAHHYYHIPYESSQHQIVLASPSVRFSENGYYAGKIAVSLLGASMFGRLFVELREKRGLCYSVYARHGATTSYGTVTAYVGTTPERAQESLDVLLHEMQGLKGSATPDELERAKTNLKASLVMGEESPASRSSSNATDWWFLKRIRTLAEINGEIDKVTVESVDAFLANYPFRPCSLLTLGKKELTFPSDLVGGGR